MKPTSGLTSDVVEVDDYWEWDALVRRNDWTDGLPVAPPTEEKVAAIVDSAAGGPPDLAAIGEVMRRHGLTPVAA